MLKKTEKKYLSCLTCCFTQVCFYLQSKINKYMIMNSSNYHCDGCYEVLPYRTFHIHNELSVPIFFADFNHKLVSVKISWKMIFYNDNQSPCKCLMTSDDCNLFLFSSSYRRFSINMIWFFHWQVLLTDKVPWYPSMSFL